MIRPAFSRLFTAYSLFPGFSVLFAVLFIATTVWMATTHSVAPELLQRIGPVLRASQDPRVESHIPLNGSVAKAFRKVEVPGWEFDFWSGVPNEKLTHTLGILSLHNGGTYGVEPLTAPVEFVSALEAAAEDGVDGVEQFLVDAGNGTGWRESDYEEYETVVIHLEASRIEEFLLKGFIGSLMVGIPMLFATIMMFLKK